MDGEMSSDFVLRGLMEKSSSSCYKVVFKKTCSNVVVAYSKG